MGVFSDDFATVDFREELCYHSRPKKTNLRGALSGHETNKRKLCAAEKATADPKRVSGDGSAPPRFRFGFPCCSCCLFCGVGLAAASAASRTCLCQAHATVPNKPSVIFQQRVSFYSDIKFIAAIVLPPQENPCFLFWYT